MEFKTVKILKEESYRSDVHITIDDMVRVTLTCSKNEWHIIKKYIKDLHIAFKNSG